MVCEQIMIIIIGALPLYHIVVCRMPMVCTKYDHYRGSLSVVLHRLCIAYSKSHRALYSL